MSFNKDGRIEQLRALLRKMDENKARNKKLVEAESSEHKKGVIAAEKYLKDEGYTLKTLPTISEHKPDAYGEKQVGNTIHKVLIEVETADSIDIDHSKEQMSSFSDWASKFNTRKAILFVPMGSLDEAKCILADYNDFFEY